MEGLVNSTSGVSDYSAISSFLQTGGPAISFSNKVLNLGDRHKLMQL